jgi:hypothetical protein
MSVNSKMDYEPTYKFLKVKNKDIIDEEKKNLLLKEQLQYLNFSQVEQLYDDIKKIEENLNSKVKIQQKLLHLKKEMNENLYNIKGEIDSIKKGIDDKDDFFTKITKTMFLKLYIKIKNKQNIYHISIRKVTDTLKNNLLKIQKNSFVIFTNLRPILEINSDEYSLVFSPTFETKIYLQMKQLVDSEYDINIDIAKNNEFDFIRTLDSNGISKIISIFPSSFFDFENLLKYPLKNSLIPINNLFDYQIEKEVTIIGIINKIRILNDNKGAIIKVDSLIDLNIISIIIKKDRQLYIDLKKNMLVIFKNYIIKFNSNYKIILRNSLRSSNENIYLIKDEEIERYNRNKIKNISKRNFQSIINLTSNLCSRNLEKYLITIKKFLNIEGFFKENNSIIPECSNLQLKGKIIIDDGSYEAISFIDDNELIKLLDLSKKELSDIYEIILKDNSLNILEQLNEKFINKIMSKQYIIYSYSFMKNYKNKNNRLTDYFGEILDLQYQQNSNIKKMNKNNYCFINGQIIEKKNYNGINYLEKRPYIKIVQIEIINT